SSNLVSPPVRKNDRAVRAVRHDHLRRAERRDRRLVDAAEDHLGLLLGQLQDRDVLEQLRIEVCIEPEWPGLARANEALAVERDAPPARELREGLSREVGSKERR